MDIHALYKLWFEKAVDDSDILTELENIKGNEEEIKDRFYKNLEFGTGGLRGVIGAGTNRMNVYTVRRASQGFASYLKERFENPKVAIAYDSRIKSDRFAKEAACVFAANGVKAYIFPELEPTPVLSFAVRELMLSGGVVITASHNPSKYNGYKAYGADGCQMTIDAAAAVLAQIEKTDMFDGVKSISFEQGLADGSIEYICNNVLERFFENVMAQSVNPDLCAKSGLKVVYTPLNGTGNKPVREILSRIGISDVTVVPEQENPDGTFPTCPYPNPEIREALSKGLELCEKVQPDLLLATDPDCDRVGIAVPAAQGKYVLFTGNEVGAMLLDYICEQRTAKGTMPERPVAIKTIVSSDIIFEIAKVYNLEVIETLTGFKFIGEQIGLLEEKGEKDRYIFGYEESYGYLAGTYARDKDAVVASMLICEMAAFYRSQGISMLQARDNMYAKYGVYFHKQESFTFEGASGMLKMKEMMQSLRDNTPSEICNLKVIAVSDYLSGKRYENGEEFDITLPKSDVIGFALENNAGVIIRPSGTEPKIKAYYTTRGDSTAQAEKLCQELDASFRQILGIG